MSYLRGEIFNTDPVIIMTVLDGLPLYLYVDTDQRLFFGQHVSGTAPVVVSFDATTGRMSYTINGITYYITGIGINPVATSTTVPSSVILALVQRVAVIAPMMAGVSYVVQVTGVPLTWNVGITSATTNPIWFLPITQYPLSTCAMTSTVEQTVGVNEAFFDNTGSQYKAFTNSSDCSTGVFYDYCMTGQTCSPNCKGPCPNGGDCSFRDIGWSCPPVVSIPPIVQVPSFNWMWIILIVLVIIIIGFIIWYMWNRNTNCVVVPDISTPVGGIFSHGGTSEYILT